MRAKPQAMSDTLRQRSNGGTVVCLSDMTLARRGQCQGFFKNVRFFCHSQQIPVSLFV